MRKYLKFIYLFIFMLITIPVFGGQRNIHFAYDGTIGGTEGKLDNIDICNADGAGYDTQDKDAAIVWDQAGNRFIFYIMDIDNAVAESDPLIIAPDECDSVAYTGDARWLIADVRAGNLKGGPPTLNKSGAYDVTVEEARGGIIVYQSGNQVDTGLPAVADEMVVCVFATGADGSAELYLEPGGSDHIDFEGLAANAGEHLRNSSDAKDDYICVIGEGANTWKTWGYRGTWVEETPP